MAAKSLPQARPQALDEILNDGGKVMSKDLLLLMTLLNGVYPDWKLFGSSLGIKYDTIQAIERKPVQKDVRMKMIEMFDKYKKMEGPKKWQDIANALRALGNNNLANTMPQDGDVPVDDADYTNTMMEIYQLKQESAKWKMLGLYLKIPNPLLKEIDADGMTVENCMLELLDTWIQGEGSDGGGATIHHIIDACKSVGDCALAEKLTKNKDVQNIMKRKNDDQDTEAILPDGSKGSGMSKEKNCDYLAFVITNTYERKNETNNCQFKIAKNFETDRRILLNLFTKRNVKMIHYDNNSFDEIWEKVDKEVAAALHLYKGVFIVFSGHGDENIAKNGCYLVSGKTNQRCDTQKFINAFNQKIDSSIPTVFLIDACRGSKSLPYRNHDSKGQSNCLIAYSTGKGEESHLPSEWIPTLAIHLAKGGDTIKNIVIKVNKECYGDWCHPDIENSLQDDFKVDLRV